MIEGRVGSQLPQLLPKKLGSWLWGLPGHRRPLVAEHRSTFRRTRLVRIQLRPSRLHGSARSD